MYLEKIEHITIPRYLTIAVDIATRIASGSILEGEKLKDVRSFLPNTMSRLKQFEDPCRFCRIKVVRINASSGNVVLSKKAVEFVKNFKSDSFVEMKQKLSRLIKSRTALDQEIEKTIQQITICTNTSDRI